jgi:UDP-glucose-4-epimerase GalE
LTRRVLVTGGAGYIGSHTLKELSRRGYSPICFDNLSVGFRALARGAPLVVGDLASAADLDRAFADGPVEAVIHFAAHALVGESSVNPHKYFRDNIGNALSLLDAMRRHGTRTFILSSTCSVYGIPREVPIREDAPLDPINPYGASKMMIERILRDFEAAHGMRWVALRYFNAAGADPGGELGERHRPETHLIPRALDVALGSSPALEIYGDDYPTPDGTCLRDYIHVTDLASAHIEALEFLARGNASGAFNLGVGRGSSVREVVRQVEETTGVPIRVEVKPRRAGDPPALVADPTRAHRELGWSPRHSSIREIVETAWNWHRQRRELE